MKSVTIFCVNIVMQKEYKTAKNVEFIKFLKHIDNKKIMSVTM
jgi:hypothetical protein